MQIFALLSSYKLLPFSNIFVISLADLIRHNMGKFIFISLFAFMAILALVHDSQETPQRKYNFNLL